ncbi:DUF935 domain-containing protein [Maritimibacter sp. HL-12]|uniref:DUF935 domain-containing protein n=1 Tax=Maritimibacter sp. HL-12 TaxID=1162418 RepID=UPI000A0EF99A|nr:DUF935 domain-containing protein [Maritimibacter sp. HL-12]SMH35916.1 Mu-like prophage protein gp29 [Maritimibacter sp. HL-12]
MAEIEVASQLLGPDGRPVVRKVLTREVAEPGITSVRQAFAPTVASGLTPQKLAGILRACDDGETYEFLVLAEEMEERDPHYASVLGMRKRAISGVTPTVKAASEDPQDEKIAKAVREHIAEHDGFSDLVEDALDALGKGFSAIEIVWGRSARLWWPDRFRYRPGHFFTFDRDTGEELRLRDVSAPVDGLALDPFKWIVHRAKMKSGLAMRGGLARVVAFSWMCKAYDLKDWMAFVETYGLPLRLGRYGPEATAKDVQTLFTAVANIGTDAAAVLPRSMEIDFEQVSAGSVGERIFESLARFLDEQISKAVLGQTMTADNGSSNSQAQVHNDVRLDLAQADARGVTGTLNRDLVRPFVDLNFGKQARYPHLAIDIEEPEDITALVNGVAKLVPLGLRVKQSELRGRLKLSEPEKEDEVIAGRPAAALPATNTALNRETVPSDEIDEIEAEMQADWEDVMEPILGPIEDLIAEATSYEDAMERLAEVLPNIATAPVIGALVKGMFKARVMGDVKDG